MSLLRTRPATTTAMLAIFDDAATIRHALAFEAALARAEAAEGLISTDVVDAIVATCNGIGIKPADLAEDAALAGTLAIPLVARLRAATSSEAAEKIHLGATSQDIADTVLMLQVKRAARLLAIDIERVCASLYALAGSHGDTPNDHLWATADGPLGSPDGEGSYTIAAARRRPDCKAPTNAPSGASRVSAWAAVV